MRPRRAIALGWALLDVDGKPVRGLGPADFLLLVDGSDMAVEAQLVF